VFIVKKIQSIVTCFLWSGTGDIQNFHLVNWEVITKDKESGGWGLLELLVFGWDLLIKSLWWALYGKGLWKNIIKVKHMKRKVIMEWFRRGGIGVRSGSYIWFSFYKFKRWFLHKLWWSFGKGNQILIGIDSMIGVCSSNYLLQGLDNILHVIGISFLD